MSHLKCPKCGADIGAAVAARAGSATSRAKAAAARRNGRLGGRPKKPKHSPLEETEK